MLDDSGPRSATVGNGTICVTGSTAPPLVEGRGQVFFQGEPLSLGEVTTQPDNPKLEGAIGFLDGEGRFVLQTEIHGDRIPGAYVGKHKVRARKYGERQGMSQPLVVPEQYASFETTPLTIVISESPSENEFRLTLEGELPESLIYLPVTSKTRPIGVITVQSFQKNVYTRYHLNMLRNLANYCAIALENSESYQKLNQTRMEFETLN